MSRTLMLRLFVALSLSVGILLAYGGIMDAAHAQGMGTTNPNFSCKAGRPSGTLYNSGATCPTTMRFDNVFSYLVCNMEQLSSNIMGNMYCGMVTNLRPMVIAALTLAVMVFGMAFTIGATPATAREFQKFLIKVAFVLVFATQSEYLIGIAYRFLVEGAREGITIALSGLYKPADGSDPTSANVYQQLDSFLGHVVHFATDSVGGKVDDAKGVDTRCQNAIFSVMAIMAVAFPPLFYLSLLIVVRIALTFLRAVFGYIYALVGIAFLLSLAPFFLSFYLFQTTRPNFDKWLGYLVSFTLQIVILFAFLTFIVSIDVKNLGSGITSIIMPEEETKETTSFRMPWQYCTLCEFEVLDKDGKVIAENQYKSFIGKGTLRCKTPKKAIKVLSTYAPGTGVQGTLLKFAGSALLSLLVLAYVVDHVLRLVPSLAQRIASGLSQFTPQLGGGMSPSGIPVADVPGIGRYEAGRGYSGVFGSFEKGFNDGFTKKDGDSISRTAAGMKQGMSRMVGGSGTSGGDPGMKERFARWVSSPLGDQDDH